MTEDAEKATRSSPFAAFASRDYRLFLAARVLATVAVLMLSTAVGYQVYEITRDPLSLGLVGLAQFAPVALLSIPAGQLVDRRDRKRLVALCDAAYVVCAIAFYLLSRSAAPTTAGIYAILVLLGAVRALYGPSASSLLPAVVPEAHFANAVSWNSSFWQLAAITGPVTAGLIYDAAGARTVYLVSAIMASLALVMALAIRAKPAQVDKQPVTLATAFAGLRYVLANKILLGSISLDFVAVFLGGAVALLPIYAKDILAVDARGFGMLRAAPAVGAGATAMVLAFRPIGGKAGIKMLVAVAVFGAATIVFGLSKSFALSLAALVTLGAADMVSVVVRRVLEQNATPDAMRGRVSAVNMVFIGASNELGELESGTLASLIGVVPAVVAGGAGTLVVVLAWAALFPALRRVHRLSDVKPI